MRAILAKKVILSKPEESILSVITRMAEIKVDFFGIAFIISQDFKLLGVFNQGDIIRSVSKGINLNIPVEEVMIKNPIFVREDVDDFEIIEEVKRNLWLRNPGTSKQITQFVPVLNNANELVDVINVFEILTRFPHRGENVVIFGMGFVGLTLAGVLSNRGHFVQGIDKNLGLIELLNSCTPHVYEPRLSDLMELGLNNGSLSFSSLIPDKHFRIKIITVGTPVSDQQKILVDDLLDVCLEIGKNLKKGDLVMLRSTVPVGTTREKVIPILEKQSNLTAGKTFFIAFTPERTVEGKAVQELTSLPQIVGGLTEKCVEIATNFWSTISPSVVRVESLEAAEMVKLINNSYRDLSFAFANSTALFCDKFNLDAHKLIKSANEGYPRNPIPIPSPGVGGYCLTKDPYLFALEQGEMAHAKLARLGREINVIALEYPKLVFTKFLANNKIKPENSKVVILGMAFKGIPETNDMRYSSGVFLAHELVKYGANVECWDAIIDQNSLKKEGLMPLNKFKNFEEVDAVFIMNNHPKNSKQGMLQELTKKKSLLFDGWNLFEKPEIEKLNNITYSTMGYMTPVY